MSLKIKIEDKLYYKINNACGKEIYLSVLCTEM